MGAESMVIDHRCLLDVVVENLGKAKNLRIDEIVFGNAILILSTLPSLLMIRRMAGYDGRIVVS